MENEGCVDFIVLNKACPNDSFSLPKIDQIVNSIVGYKVLSFIDTYSIYNQIKMNLTCKEKNSIRYKPGTILLSSHALCAEKC